METTERGREAPEIVGRYAIYDEIAAGGMATVHLGRLMGPVGFSRVVAIKRLHSHLARDPNFTTMFLDEARLVARIRHPNVVPTLDVVALEHELLLVMEYVAGQPLSRLLAHARETGTPPPVPVVVDIMISVLHGLHAAHEATNEVGDPLHIVHRDVSPHNIIVGTDGIARVLDFGVAKAVGQGHHTRSGEVKGKLHYMPPEQITGGAVTRSADIYAASVVLWEALTSTRLCAGTNAVEVLYHVLHEEIVPPSSLRSGLPAAIDEVVLRGLQRAPADRWETAMAMAQALEAVAPAVKRSAVGEWVRESSMGLIQARESQVANIEGAAMAAATKIEPKPDSSRLQGTLSALSHSSLFSAPRRWRIFRRPTDPLLVPSGSRGLSMVRSRVFQLAVGISVFAAAGALFVTHRSPNAPLAAAEAEASVKALSAVAALGAAPGEAASASATATASSSSNVASPAVTPVASAPQRRPGVAAPKPPPKAPSERLYRRE